MNWVFILLISNLAFVQAKEKSIKPRELENFKIEKCLISKNDKTPPEINKNWLENTLLKDRSSGSVRFKTEQGKEINLEAVNGEGERGKRYSVNGINCQHKLILISVHGWEDSNISVYSLVDGSLLLNDFLFMSEDGKFFIKHQTVYGGETYEDESIEVIYFNESGKPQSLWKDRGVSKLFIQYKESELIFKDGNPQSINGTFKFFVRRKSKKQAISDEGESGEINFNADVVEINCSVNGSTKCLQKVIATVKEKWQPG